MRQTTVGQLLVNEILPEDIRDYHRVMDKKGLKGLLRTVMDRYPDRYREIVHQLSKYGGDFAFRSGSSFSLDDLSSSKTKLRIVADVNKRLVTIINNPRWDDDRKNSEIVKLLASRMDEMRDGTHAEGVAEGNNFSRAIQSGARGNTANLSSLRGADLMVLDHKDRPIPIPILNNFSEGLSPAEYFAGAYGTRKGVVSAKLATASSGFLSKQLTNAANNLIITDDEPLEGTGLPVDSQDEDNEGAVLARDYGEFSSGTVLTPSILRVIRKHHKEILVHSPISAGGRGIPRIAAGYRERGGFSPIGDNVGIAAAQSAAERLAQTALSAKHAAGVVGASRQSISGFQAINQLVQVPKNFQNAATVATLDGQITRIDEAPQGGSYVFIGGERHYVNPGSDILVKPGDSIEAGDAINAGISNPADIVRYKHIGEGRRYLMNQLRNTLREQGIGINRRNVEIIARSLINHVRVLEPDAVDGALPDDIISYDELASRWKPRFGNFLTSPALSRGRYLEKPALHYSIGTRITPTVINTLKRHKVSQITAHNDPPPFEPHMVRAMESTLYDKDWFRRISGFYVGKGFLDSVRRGSTSEIHGQNWGHSLATAKNFGEKLETEGAY